MMKINFLGVVFHKIDVKFQRVKFLIKQPELTTYDFHHRIPSISDSLGSDDLFSIADVDGRFGFCPVGT